MKVHPFGAELFYVGGRTDRQMDMMKLIVALRNCAKALDESLSVLSNSKTLSHSTVIGNSVKSTKGYFRVMSFRRNLIQTHTL
jgi:flagellar hook assembly protein FlgD